VRDGAFRKGIDATQLAITIAAINSHYLGNRFTGSIVYGRNLMDEVSLHARLKFNIDTIMRLVSAQ
jgi:hypothetical protein